jgi:hypothetical protein
MSTFTEPTPTRGDAPSHSPPDVHYAPGIGLARKLGWFSIGLGLTEMLAPRLVSRMTGVRNETLIQGFGLRELVVGVGILSSNRPTNWIWARVAGDAMDLAVLGDAIVESDCPTMRERAIFSTTAVAGVTALDTACGLALCAGATLEG